MNYIKEGKVLKFARTIPNTLSEDNNASIEGAIERAKTLHEACKDLPYHQQNPVTLVYLLVEKLKKNSRPT